MQVCDALAHHLGCEPREILPFSTGVIMEPLPAERITAALPKALLDKGNWLSAAEAIMTTDTLPKASSRKLRLSTGEATVTGIANMIYAFALHPDQWRTLRDNPSQRRKAFEEALRWDSPVQTFFRTTTHVVELGGTMLPAGAKILLFLAAANRDPRRWDQPERFDISRQASGHVGFGFGIHQCLGQMVARLEAETLLEALLPRVAEIRLAGTPVRRLNNTLHAFLSMPVEINPV